MNFVHAATISLLLAISTMSGNALAEDVFVRIESVKGEVLVYLEEGGDSPIRVQTGDVLVAPLKIETGAESMIDITVDGKTLSISPDSSIVVENFSADLANFKEQST